MAAPVPSERVKATPTGPEQVPVSRLIESLPDHAAVQAGQKPDPPPRFELWQVRRAEPLPTELLENIRQEKSDDIVWITQTLNTKLLQENPEAPTPQCSLCLNPAAFHTGDDDNESSWLCQKCHEWAR